MEKIKVLNNETIDKIAAGEVVERPFNVVKELVENSIDAKATSISVELKSGKTNLIRVTDNGCGIEADEVKTAFLRHATSKLTSVNDFETLHSMGFRGEALSSICAVSMSEMITKTKESLLGTRIVIEGGKINEISEVGAPDGTTIIVRNLFYNTPARKKFLKSEMSENSMVQDLMEKFSLSHPEISFQFLLNSNVKVQTAGNNDLKDCIYRVYGKDIYNRLLKVDYEKQGIRISGYICKPEYTSSLRSEEIFFANERMVKSKVLSVAVEEGFQGYLMQHRFPFCVIKIDTDPSFIDVNVHPQKLEVRFSDNELVSNAIIEAVKDTLKIDQLIPSVTLDDLKFKDISIEEEIKVDEIKEETSNINAYKEPVIIKENKPEHIEPFEIKRTIEQKIVFDNTTNKDYEQKDLFESRIINDDPIKKYNIIGQVFDTYWLISLDNDLYIVDQHAAHEKVNYENFLNAYNGSEEVLTQQLMPSASITLSTLKADVLKCNLELFEKIGFEIEDFGQDSFVIRSIPVNLYGLSYEELFSYVLEEIVEKESVKTPIPILEKLASMSCKAAVKGNNRLSFEEMNELMNKLMKLENPYNCPHGRPVFIKITKTELEKKFKRIV